MANEEVLIVDDNATNLKLAGLVLKLAGYIVLSAVDAKNAHEVLSTCEPGLILMDIQLPDMDGLELTRLIKANPATNDVIILAMTAYAMKGDEERALSAGCDGYITKPIDTRTLAATVARYLEAKP